MRVFFKSGLRAAPNDDTEDPEGTILERGRLESWISSASWKKGDDWLIGLDDFKLATATDCAGFACSGERGRKGVCARVTGIDCIESERKGRHEVDGIALSKGIGCAKPKRGADRAGDAHHEVVDIAGGTELGLH